MQMLPTSIRLVVTTVLVMLSIYYMAEASMTVAYLLIATFFTITFIAPGVLVWAQRYKNEIRGPWDVAVPQLR